MQIPKQIVIVGGGTAGWMAANLLHHQLSAWRVKVTLIESPAIATVGVGEGSTPFLKEFFDTLGIAEQTWMPACSATYKCGIRFPDWSPTDKQDSYFHPFYSDSDGPFAQAFFTACNEVRAGNTGWVNPDEYFLTQYLASQHRAPKLDDGKWMHSYGYHFDAELLGRFLRQHAINAGVQHIEDSVNRVHLNSQGDIAILATDNHGPVRGDFFVDCSGFRGLLIQQALEEQLTSFKDHLFCDRAVALPTDLEEHAISSQTISRGLNAGWMWRIPLTNRFGNGYVYSSDYLSAQEAEDELRAALNEHNSEARHLKWTPGRIERHWKNNCLAVGLSQGFLEPLEAPMLFIIQRTIEGFISHIAKGETSEADRDAFNRDMNTRIDGTRDYLQAHYKLNSRTDTQFWRDCRNNNAMSETLRDLISTWQAKGNFDEALARHQSRLAYLKTSWYCLFAGHRFAATSSPGNSATCSVSELEAQLNLMSARYPDHKGYLTSQQVFQG